jgi:putative SOS response-associated peptidase YedK
MAPFWAKDEKIGYKMINARAETLQIKLSFRKTLSLQRCIIPAGGFFEWKQFDKEKIHYYIFLKNKELFGFDFLNYYRKATVTHAPAIPAHMKYQDAGTPTSSLTPEKLPTSSQAGTRCQPCG